MSRPAYFVAPWDLHRALPCIPDRADDGTVVLVESVAKGQALPYHRKKLVLVLSAMHHFARALRDDGYDVSIVHAPSYVEGIARHVEERGASEVIAMRPREWGLEQALARAEAEETFGVPLTLHDDGGPGRPFLLPRNDFASWAEGRKSILQHHFYQWMRKRTGWLMDGKSPVGGKWSFDADNRKPAGETPPRIPRHEPDALTREIMDRVATWPGHWGQVDGFDWPVTRQAALAELDHFFTHRARSFGPYQDAMLGGEKYMWHTLLSTSLNLSLLLPHEVCERVLAAYEAEAMPLASAEGLLRQILGWREYMRGIYWLRMPGMRDDDQLDAHRPLPNFFWDETKTDLHCIRQSVGQVRETGYAHHIQRLMVLGNFALLAGIRPLDVSHWFWAGFVDAFEWVELPNVHGMALFASDGFTTKPYAASASYIHKMSDYCGDCRYAHTKKTGEKACPFNSLYWHFMTRHRERLESNHRLRMIYGSWDKMDEPRRDAILDHASAFLDQLEPADEAWTFDDDAG